MTSLRQPSLCMKGLNDLLKEELNLCNFPDDLVIVSKVFGVIVLCNDVMKQVMLYSAMGLA